MVKVDYLDHGFVDMIDYMGGDEDIVRAARISRNLDRSRTNVREFITKLIRDEHTSPFEMVVIKFEIKCPIFVARQVMRHRTASINELSRRYVEVGDDDEFYIPNVKDEAQDIYSSSYTESVKKYKELLAAGIPTERARLVLPVALYTRFYWKMDLHNLMHFLKLRMSLHTQLETRILASCIAKQVMNICPITMDIFLKENKLNIIDC